MADNIAQNGSGVRNITTGASEIQDVSGGSDVSKTVSYTVQQEVENLIPSGSVSIDKKATEALEDIVTVSGLRMVVKEKTLNITRNSVRSTVSLTGELDKLLQKSVDQGIIYVSFSPDEASSFENSSRSIVKGKVGDAFGRGAWTNHQVLQDLATLLGITVVCNVYEYWIKQFEVSDTQTVFSAIQSLTSIFKPKLFYRDGVLYILQAFKPDEWQGLATIPNAVEQLSQKESSLQLPKKLRLIGGMGAFDPSKYPGSMTLASRSGTSQVGEHSYSWFDYGTSSTATETLSEETFKVDSESEAVSKNKTKTVHTTTSGVDAFGNVAFTRFEKLAKYSQKNNEKEEIIEEEAEFNKHTHTHWRYTNPRLTFTAKATGEKVACFEVATEGKSAKPLLKPEVGGQKYSMVFIYDKESYFEETVLNYENRTGRLKSKVTRRTGDIVGYYARKTDNVDTENEWTSTTLKYTAVPEIPSDVEVTGMNFKSSEDKVMTVPFIKDYPVYIQYLSYKQVSKRYYTVTNTEYSLNTEVPFGLYYDVKTSIAQIPAGDVPTNRIDYRKMQIWVEKEIGGTGPVIEISDSNIIDWKQAADILEEIAWQFTSNKRYTTFDLAGEFMLDTGAGIKSATLSHAKSGISAEPLGDHPIIAGVARQKDASSGTVTTTVAVEGMLG